MILISFPALKASINCLKKSIEPVLMLCKSLNDVLTLHWFTADREKQWDRNTHTHNIGTVVYNSHIDTAVPFLGVWLCLSCSCHKFFFQNASSRVKRFTRTNTCICAHAAQRFNSPEFDLIWFKLAEFNNIQLNSKHCCQCHVRGVL